MKARIVLRYKTLAAARTISKAVSPDNKVTPESLQIMTRTRGRTVETTIRCKGRIETLIATMEDLLSCVQAAEKTLTASTLGPKP